MAKRLQGKHGNMVELHVRIPHAQDSELERICVVICETKGRVVQHALSMYLGHIAAHEAPKHAVVQS